MKSERKQIQESNLLADKIETQFIKLKKALPAILAVAVITIGGLLGYGLYASVQENAAAKGWTKLYFADTDPNDLSSLANDFQGTSAALWAKQTAGDGFLAKALERVYVDREIAEQFFQQAIDEYKAASASSDSFLKERAFFGQAQAAEGLGDSEQAIACYRKVAGTQGISPELLTIANQRITWIESKAGAEFYAWFQQRKTAVPPLQNAEPVKLPLSDKPDMSFGSTGTPTPAEVPPSNPPSSEPAPATTTDPATTPAPTPTPEAAPPVPTVEPTAPSPVPTESPSAEPK